MGIEDKIHNIVVETMTGDLERKNDLTDLEWKPPLPNSSTDSEPVIVRRYVDFTKFLSILESGLWFNRLDNFPDSFEGKYPDSILRRRWQTYEYLEMEDDPPPFNLYDYRTAYDKIIRKQSFVSCWKWGGDESAIFWDAYIGDAHGLAIETTLNNLVSVFEQTDHEVVLGQIKYLNYENETIPEDSVAQVFHKRTGFRDEQELRALIRHEADNITYHVEKNGSINVDVDALPGLNVEISPDELIDAVVLAPGTNEWIASLISDVLDTYDINADIFRSRLDADPDMTAPRVVGTTASGETVAEVVKDGMQFYQIVDGDTE